MCCCTTTGESVIGIMSLFSGVTIFWTLNSSVAERAQECPSIRVVIWATDRYYPKLDNMDFAHPCWYITNYHLKLHRTESTLDPIKSKENKQVFVLPIRKLSPNLQLYILLFLRDRDSALYLNVKQFAVWGPLML